MLWTHRAWLVPTFIISIIFISLNVSIVYHTKRNILINRPFIAKYEWTKFYERQTLRNREREKQIVTLELKCDGESCIWVKQRLKCYHTKIETISVQIEIKAFGENYAQKFTRVLRCTMVQRIGENLWWLWEAYRPKSVYFWHNHFWKHENTIVPMNMEIPYEIINALIVFCQFIHKNDNCIK